MSTVKHRIRKILLILMGLFVFGIICLAALNLYVISFAKPYTLSSDQAAEITDADCILVLGCGVRGTSPTPLLADRLERGVEIFQKGAAPKILMSGDHGQDDYDEVNVMKEYAMVSGIAEEHIFMDHAGFSTYESMYRAKEIFGADKIIIVTQKYHLSRALFIANHLGIEAYGVASDYRTFGGQFYRDCREVLARVKDIFTVITRPKPTYLGEAIPISGDGTITNG